MNLNELQENKKTKIVKRALREHYDVRMNFERLTLKQTQNMLLKVRGLLKETRSSRAIHKSHDNPSYVKLVMVEQALSAQMVDLRNQRSRIVVENEEVQKSQVILAAQDMIDSIQKMLEQISKMNVEELNAVVDGIKNEFGSAEGEQYNTAASEALSALQESLSTAKNSLTTALGTVTGDTSADAAMPGDDMGLGAPDMDPAADMPEPEMPDMSDMPEEEPEEPMNMAGIGRERR